VNFGSYVVLIGGLCTTGWHETVLRRLFVDSFSFCLQIPVLLVFYQYEQKMTSTVKGSKQAWILDPRRIHQQSYPQVVDVLFAFG